MYWHTPNLMRYNNHFMYIKDLKQVRHCYICKKNSKMFQNMEACNHHEKTCDELVKHIFPGGKYDKIAHLSLQFKKILCSPVDLYTVFVVTLYLVCTNYILGIYWC